MPVLDYQDRDKSPFFFNERRETNCYIHSIATYSQPLHQRVDTNDRSQVNQDSSWNRWQLWTMTISNNCGKSGENMSCAWSVFIFWSESSTGFQLPWMLLQPWTPSRSSLTTRSLCCLSLWWTCLPCARWPCYQPHLASRALLHVWSAFRTSPVYAHHLVRECRPHQIHKQVVKQALLFRYADMLLSTDFWWNRVYDSQRFQLELSQYKPAYQSGRIPTVKDMICSWRELNFEAVASGTCSEHHCQRSILELLWALDSPTGIWRSESRGQARTNNYLFVNLLITARCFMSCQIPGWMICYEVHTRYVSTDP